MLCWLKLQKLERPLKNSSKSTNQDRSARLPSIQTSGTTARKKEEKEKI